MSVGNEQEPKRDPNEQALHAAVKQTKAFTRPNDAIAAWQVLSTLALLLATFTLTGSYLAPGWATLSMPLLMAVFVRLFVLQHDAGHHSLLTRSSLNDAVGTLLSFITGVSYEAWRSEHAWHHNNQSKLSMRGVDRMNSPMTVAEALAKPQHARLRAKKISALSIFVLGALSLVVIRKRTSGFFQFRPNFRGNLGGRARMRRGVWLTNAGHAAYHALLFWWLGWELWFTWLIPAIFASAALGSFLFWVQHNFENSYHSEDDTWSFAAAALRGSSYLRLTGPLRYFTANIGLHHVHHLNPRIANYRLEEARNTIPLLRQVRPLTRQDLRRCFTHVFWDPARGRMVSLDEL
jgi:acyl-lipid omega-6 desaturase (Delta-12 desaturase)